MAVHEQDPVYASPHEASRALASMSEADMARVERFARIRAAGLEPWDWEDLLNEAVARLLSGSRRWPRDLPLVVFFRETMRSLAQEERRRRHQAAYPVSAASELEIQSMNDDRPGPEREAIARDQLRRLIEHFETDRAVAEVITGLERGETAGETCARAGLSPQSYDAARKRFRRSVDAWLLESERP